MPKVSVIVPVYGVEKYIERCVRSLFEQTLDDIEYLFIDDCTPDRSVEILLTVLEDYPYRKEQVVIHRMEKNSGQAAVRKWGMQNARGEYLIHCDGDDWVDKTMYEEMYQEAFTEGYGIVFCGNEETDGVNSSKVINRNVNNTTSKSLLNRVLVTDDLNSLCCALIKKDLLSGIVYPIGNMGEDKTIMIQVCINAGRVGSINKAFYHYLRHTGSLTIESTQSIIEKKVNDVIENMNIILNCIKKSNLYKENCKSLVAYIVYSHRICFKSKNKQLVRRLFTNLFVGDTKFFLFNPYINGKFKIKIILKFFLPNLLLS